MTMTHQVIEAPPKTRGKWKKRLVRAALVLLVLLIVGAGALWILKPWVPDIVLAEPGPTGERIVRAWDLRELLPGEGAARDAGPAVLLVGGSEGGIGTGVRAQALDLQERGVQRPRVVVLRRSGAAEAARARPARDVRPRTRVAREASGGRRGTHGRRRVSRRGRKWRC